MIAHAEIETVVDRAWVLVAIVAVEVSIEQALAPGKVEFDMLTSAISLN